MRLNLTDFSVRKQKNLSIIKLFVLQYLCYVFGEIGENLTE